MHHFDLIVLVLVSALAGLAVIAYLIRVPYPILLVGGGLVIGFLPGAPDVELDPDVVLAVFLPPLLYSAAFFSSLRDLRRSARPIALLSIGLVVLTMVTVAVAAHAVIGLDWPVAFVLGAVVSPTDAVAPAEILRRLNAPRRLITVVEGENLTNDWTALVLYKFAVAAVVSGSFSLLHAGPKFVLTGVGGLAVGLAVGWLVRMLRRHIDDPPTAITVSLVTGYLAFIPAEEIGVSGVIAAVTVGIYMGWHTPELTTPVMRLQGYGMWEIFQFVVNALLFLLVGLQFPNVIDDISGAWNTGELIGWAVLVCAVVIVVRMAWGFTVPYLLREFDRRINRPRPRTSPAERIVVGWAGMRGAVALAAALAIPLETDAGAAFPERDLIIFLTLSVIIATLVLQGLTLGPLIDRLGICDQGEDEEEEIHARLRTVDAALGRLDELEGEEWVREDTLERARGLLNFRRRRFEARSEGSDDDGYEERSGAYQRLLRAMLDAQRRELVALRNSGDISDEVRRRLERELDLEETRLDS